MIYEDMVEVDPVNNVDIVTHEYFQFLIERVAD